MTHGLRSDWERTLDLLSQENPTLFDGNTTWLRHLRRRKSGIIDVMVFEGVHTIEGIADRLVRDFGGPRELAIRRVVSHVGHLQDGAPGGHGGYTPHGLHIIFVDGIIQFNRIKKIPLFWK